MPYKAPPHRNASEVVHCWHNAPLMATKHSAPVALMCKVCYGPSLATNGVCHDSSQLECGRHRSSSTMCAIIGPFDYHRSTVPATPCFESGFEMFEGALYIVHGKLPLISLSLKLTSSSLVGEVRYWNMLHVYRYAWASQWLHAIFLHRSYFLSSL